MEESVTNDFLRSFMPSTYAASGMINPDTNGKVVSTNVLQQIEDLNNDIVELRMELSKNNETGTIRRQDIENIIEEKQQQMYELGAEKIEADFLEYLITIALESNSENQEFKEIAASWHPSELVSQFQSMYSMSGVTVTYGGKMQYHVIFTSRDADPYLHKITTKNIYNSFTAGSSEATKWLNDIVKIYADKLIGAGLGIASPIASWLPWELITSSKPTVNTISSSKNALITTLNTISTHKFVYVYDSSNDTWVYCLSTNRVSCSVSVTEAVNISGTAYNKSKDFGPYTIYGDWNNASADANTAFNSGYERNTCINEVNVYSTSKGVDYITHYIHTPNFVAHML